MSPLSVPPSETNPVGFFGDSTTTASHSDSANHSTMDDKENTHSQDTTSSRQIDNSLLDDILKKRSERTTKTPKQFTQFSMELFKKVQKWSSENSNLVPLSSMMMTDRQKSEISELVYDYMVLVHESKKEMDQSLEPNELERYRQNLHISDVIWPLFRILLEVSMDGKQETVIGEFFIWVTNQMEFVQPELPVSDSDEKINWKHIQSLIMNAELKQALLELKQQDRDDEYSSLVNLLSKIPKLPNSYSIYSKQSGWTVLWKEWHAEVELVWKEYERTGLFDEDSYDSNGLHITIQLLMGDQDTIMGQDDFYKRMLANLIYTDPMEHQFDMAYIATHSFDDHMDNSIEHILVYYLLTRRYHELLGAMDDYLWLQTHFGHILFAAGYLTSGQDEQLQKSLVTKTIVSEQITEPIHYLIKLYASTIAQEYGMWIEAMQCLLSCQPNTEVWIQKLLGDPPLASENINCLINALDFSITHHLIKVEIVLHSAIATRYESNQDFVLAATHYADGNNIQALDTLAAKHLEYYLGNGTLRPVVTDSKYIKLVDQSGPYSFYRRYVQVRANIKEGQLDDAYRTIMTLLHSLENASSKYRVVLLVDIFDIIRDYRRVNKQEAQELLSQLEVATKEPTEKAFFAVYYKQSHSDTIIARLRERLGFSLAADALSL